MTKLMALLFTENYASDTFFLKPSLIVKNTVIHFK